MRAGKLRHYITIETAADSIDGSGDVTESFSTLAQRWASIEPLSGREYFTAQQEASEVSHKIRLRWDSTVSAVTPKHRIAYDSRTFDIVSVFNSNERDRELMIMAIERHD